MWHEKYIGQAYSEQYDCMGLAVAVAQEFGYKVVSPSYKPNVFSQAESVNLFKDDVCTRTEEKKDGNPVLFLCRKRFYHIGVYVNILGVDYILHNDQRAKAVILTKLAHMERFGYELEGFYQWI